MDVHSRQLTSLLAEFGGPLFRFDDQVLSNGFLAADFSGADVNELFMPPIPDLMNPSIPVGYVRSSYARRASHYIWGPTLDITLPTEPAPGTHASPTPSTRSVSSGAATGTPPIASGCGAPIPAIPPVSGTVLDDITDQAANQSIATNPPGTPDSPIANRRPQRDRRAPRPADAGWVAKPRQRKRAPTTAAGETQKANDGPDSRPKRAKRTV
ncbi:hypothetical protein LXA43DRAFT_1100278 [Ganoderma leucocontextum]|nr:hypothetical protein LXA43DRAFT_1100278 [Ganoderma leucocontextum]